MITEEDWIKEFEKAMAESGYKEEYNGNIVTVSYKDKKGRGWVMCMNADVFHKQTSEAMEKLVKDQSK